MTTSGNLSRISCALCLLIAAGAAPANAQPMVAAPPPPGPYQSLGPTLGTPLGQMANPFRANRPQVPYWMRTPAPAATPRPVPNSATQGTMVSNRTPAAAPNHQQTLQFVPGWGWLPVARSTPTEGLSQPRTGVGDPQGSRVAGSLQGSGGGAVLAGPRFGQTVMPGRFPGYRIPVLRGAAPQANAQPQQVAPTAPAYRNRQAAPTLRGYRGNGYAPAYGYFPAYPGPTPQGYGYWPVAPLPAQPWR